MLSDLSQGSGRTTTSRFIQRLRLQPNRSRLLAPMSPYRAFGTLQYSVVSNNSPPLSPLPLSKRPRSPIWHLLSMFPLPAVLLGNPVSLHSKVSCKNLSVVRAHLELCFRLPHVILRPSVKSYRRSQAHSRHPQKKLDPRHPPQDGQPVIPGSLAPSSLLCPDHTFRTFSEVLWESGHAVRLSGPFPRCCHWGQGPKYPPGTCWIHCDHRQ